VAELTGRLARRLLAQGSKSEHTGMVLIDDQGRSHVLRRQGANPFRDEVLEALDGQHLRLSGQMLEHGFLVERWERADTPPAP